MGNIVGLTPKFPDPPRLKKNPFNIGEYSCIGKIGKGAFGVVYKAEKEAEKGVTYAIKLQKIRRHDQAQGVLQEINQHQGMDHPCIVKFFDASRATRVRYGSEENVVSMVLEYIDGASLEELFKQTRDNDFTVFDESLRAKWAYQMMSGVNYIHSLGKIHRDLKPANLLISRKEKNLKIADFGLSRDLDEDGQASTICGTPMYMPPEIQPGRYNSIYSTEVDIWAMGLVLLELLFGLYLDRPMNRKIFSAEWEAELTKKVDLSKAPRTLWETVFKCLRFAPKDRITSSQLLDTPIIKIYALLHGMLPEDQAGEIFRNMASDAETVVTILITIETLPDARIKQWVLEEFCANIDVIPLEGLLNPEAARAVKKLVVENAGSAMKFQNLIKIKQRRSREASPQPATMKYPKPKEPKTGWHWKPLPTKDGAKIPKRFFALSRDVSNALETLYLSSTTEGTFIMKVVPPPTTFRSLTTSDEDSSGDPLHFNFDLVKMSAKELSTERNFELKRYGPEKDASEVPLEGLVRKFQYIYPSESENVVAWVDFKEEHQKTLGMAYSIPKIESVVLINGPRTSFVVNLRKMVCLEISKNQTSPVRYLLE